MSIIWEIVYLLLGLLGNSIVAFVTSQPFHHILTATPIIVLNFLLLLLECLENLPHQLIGAIRMSHRPQPPTSRLLLLPPEIRQ